MDITIPFFVKDLLNCLRKAGYEAYPVGGAVRDSLLGLTPKDWDITTAATPGDMIDIFKDKKILTTGIKHGTITVFNCGIPVEITTFRAEGEYKDSRHPDKLTFGVSLKEDLKRRDFTVNALCIAENGEIIDFFNGVEHLNKRILKTVGDPNKRFREDGLRMLRAVRFASVYNFQIEEKTKEALFINIKRLKSISSERIMGELLKLLKGENCYNVLMEYKKVIFFIIPPLAETDGVFQRQDFHAYDVWEHIAYSVSYIEPVGYLRLTMLLHDVGKPSCADGKGHFKGHAYVGALMCNDILTSLKCSNKVKGRVIKLIRLHNMVAENTEENLRRLLYRHGADIMIDLVKVFKADNMAKRPEIAKKRREYYTEMEITLDKVIQSNPPFTVKSLKVSGDDIIGLGVQKGPLVGKILNKLSKLVAEDKIANEKQQLLTKAEEIFKTN